MELDMKQYKIVWVHQETETQGESSEPMSLPLAMAWVTYFRAANDGIHFEVAEWETGEAVRNERP